MVSLAPCLVVALGCASNRGASGGATVQEAVALEIRLAHQSPQEEQTKNQLENLVRRYELAPWRFTRTVIIDAESTPHSHPILTLHTRHLRDDLLLLSTFIHEESHWFLVLNPTATSSAVKDLKTLFPDLPVGFPEGADNLESSYEHLIVIMLERQGLIETVGELAALHAMEFWATDHYRALYRLVLNEKRKIREVLEKHGLNPLASRRS
jgi:hypothetical protein